MGNILENILYPIGYYYQQWRWESILLIFLGIPNFYLFSNVSYEYYFWRVRLDMKLEILRYINEKTIKKCLPSGTGKKHMCMSSLIFLDARHSINLNSYWMYQHGTWQCLISIPEFGSLPSVIFFAECFFSDTRQRSSLPSVTQKNTR
jgi:hypothetical protein